MNNSRTILTTLLFTCVYIITIKAFKINMKNEQLVYYSLVFFLCSFSTSKLLDKLFPEQDKEHLTDKELTTYSRDILTDFDNEINEMEIRDKRRIDSLHDVGEEEKTQCKQIEDDIVKSLENTKMRENIRKMEKDPFKYGVCSQEERDACNTVDMSKFVLNESVPKCDYVIPEQYNLFKPRKGYTPGDPAEDPTLDTLINKDNYILFFVAFVALIAIYIAVLMFKSVFK
jgi:hypothetical protein